MKANKEHEFFRVGSVQEFPSLHDHGDEDVRVVAWSPDGKYITSASDDKVIVWEPSLFRTLRTITVEDIPQRIIWSPASDRFAIIMLSSIVIANTSGEQLGKLNNCLAFDWSPDGNSIVTASKENTDNIYLDYLKTDTFSLNGPAFDVAFSPCGTMCTAIGQTQACIWILGSQKKHTFNIACGKFKKIAFSPDSNQIALGSEGYIRIFDTAHGALLKAFKIPANHTIALLKWTRDCKKVIVIPTSEEAVPDHIYVWDIFSPNSFVLTPEQLRVFKIVINQRTIATLSGKTAEIYKTLPQELQSALAARCYRTDKKRSVEESSNSSGEIAPGGI